jgi:hypothetical protein
MACLIGGDWPGHVLAAEPRTDRYRVAYLGGTAPRGQEPEVWVVSSQLVRPVGAELGRLDKTRRPGASRHGPPGTRTWSAAELRLLRDLWRERGAAVAMRQLGRSEAACCLAMKRWWGSRFQRGRSRMSGRDVARILGVDDHRVPLLLEQGYLVGKKGDVGAGGHTTRWEISADALRDFLSEHPAQYDPARVHGEPWRTLAAGAWAEAGLLTIAAAAARLFVTRHALTQKCRRGEVPGAVMSHGGSSVPYRWLIPEAALARVRVGSGGQTLSRNREAAAAAAARARGLLTKRELCALYGWSLGHAERMALEEGYPHERIRLPGLQHAVLLFRPLLVYRFSTPQRWQRGERQWPAKGRHAARRAGDGEAAG